MLVAIILVAFIGAGLLDLKLRTQFQIPKNEKFMDQYVGIWHLVLEVVLCLMFLSYISASALEKTTIYALLFAFVMFVFMLRGMLEFLFRRDKRRHIISFTYVALCAVCSVAISVFM